MPRRGSPPRRELVPDPIHGNRLLTQLTNQILTDGKKGIAESIVYGALEIIGTKTGQDPLVTFKKGMDNIKPVLEVKPRRVGGATYQVPVEVNSRRSTTLAIRWLTKYSRERREKTMQERLANEIMDAAAGQGASVKRREDLHKMAESNRAFAHYRW
jgi:small subunit ribosomal protein S7